MLATRATTPLRPTRALATGVGAAAAAAACLALLPPSPLRVLHAAVAAVLVWLAAIDVEFRLVPNRIVLPATVVSLLVVVLAAPGRALEHTLAAVVAAAGLLVLARLRPGDLGMGDVKLVLLLGAALGAPVLTALAVGFGAVGVVGVALATRSGRSALKTQVPLVPFLALGAAVALVVGA